MKMLTSGQVFLGSDLVAMSWWYSEPHFFCVWEAPLLLRRFTQVPSALLGTASGDITSTLNWQKKQSHTSTLLLHCYLYICFHFYIYVVIRCHTLSPTSLISDSSSAYGSSFSCIIWRSDNVQSPSGTGMDQVDRNCSLSAREDSVIQSWSIVFLVSIIYCRMSLSTFVFRCFPFSGAEQLR